MTMEVTNIVSLTLDLPPSCIEVCPAHPEYFLVGTYQLQEEPGTSEDGDRTADHDNQETSTIKGQTRNGSLLVFHAVDHNM
jgi:diphthine methyl ester acylhydrolase